eukprot:TRINITY_DN11594_c1_g6_i1.p1 TRINITY_DN11594_c1_g6~~TRINITY_DN11594_c1_g6_i1.p1  ORF type:complete len:114 (-),score=20.52 TRINITY_DN11594_c1_g6_i1:150-491(-)
MGWTLVLHSRFPNISCLDKTWHAVVADYCSSMGGTVGWDFCFQRDLNDQEASDFVSLLGMLDKVNLLRGRGDIRIWKPDIKSMFSVKSFFKELIVNYDKNGRLEKVLESFSSS